MKRTGILTPKKKSPPPKPHLHPLSRDARPRPPPSTSRTPSPKSSARLRGAASTSVFPQCAISARVSHGDSALPLSATTPPPSPGGSTRTSASSPSAAAVASAAALSPSPTTIVTGNDDVTPRDARGETGGGFESERESDESAMRRSGSRVARATATPPTVRSRSRSDAATSSATTPPSANPNTCTRSLGKRGASASTRSATRRAASTTASARRRSASRRQSMGSAVMRSSRGNHSRPGRSNGSARVPARATHAVRGRFRLLARRANVSGASPRPWRRRRTFVAPSARSSFTHAWPKRHPRFTNSSRLACAGTGAAGASVEAAARPGASAPDGRRNRRASGRRPRAPGGARVSSQRTRKDENMCTQLLTAARRPPRV